jgi:hypothetical protein
MAGTQATITFSEVDDALKVTGGFFNGYGWSTLGGEILEFDKGLECAHDLLNEIETTVNKIESDYNNSPCGKYGTSAYTTRPWYDNYGDCAKGGYSHCDKCRNSWSFEHYYYPTCDQYTGQKGWE